MKNKKTLIISLCITASFLICLTIIGICLLTKDKAYKYKGKIYEDSYDYKTDYGYLYLKGTNEVQSKLYEDLYLRMIDFSHRDVDLDEKKCRSIFYKEDINNKTLTFDELWQVYVYINIQNPKFYWIDDSFDQNGAYCIGVNKLYIKGSVRKEYETKIEEELKKSDKLVEGITDEFIKLKTVYDYIVDNMTYTDEFSDSVWAHNIIGFYDRGEGVCETYAKVFKFLCDRYDIANLCVVSDDHIWNLTEYDGFWYVFDLTWDSGDYVYFGKTEDIYEDDSASDDSHEYYSRLYKRPDNMATAPLSFGEFELKEDGNTIYKSHSIDSIYSHFNNGHYEIIMNCNDELITDFYISNIDSNYSSLAIISNTEENNKTVLFIEKDITLDKDITFANTIIRSFLSKTIHLAGHTIYLKNISFRGAIDIDGNNVVYFD